jgi:hypothetical protein
MRYAVDSPNLLYVRTYGSPESVVSEVRRAAAAIGPGVPLAECFTLTKEVRDSLWQERLVSILAVFSA